MIESRFIHFASAAGASARVTRIDHHTGLDHYAPVQAISLLTATGGSSESSVGKFVHSVDTPRAVNIMAFDSAFSKSWSELPTADGVHVSNTSVVVKGLKFLDLVHADLIQSNLKSVSGPKDETAAITPYDTKIEGLRLGDYGVIVELDLEPFQQCGTKAKLTEFYAGNHAFRKAHFKRFNADHPDTEQMPDYKGYSICSIVKSIRWADKAPPDATIDGYTITWAPFGKIILGELTMSHHQHRLTMIRAKMGSPIEGSGTGGDQTINGTTMP